jgi:large subunit ribosomal protein L31
MKKDIHPAWYPDAKVTCICGNTFTVGSTKSEIHVDVCAKCHPFFTGEMKLIDTAGMVEKFQARKQKASSTKIIKKSEKRQIRRMEEEAREKERPENLKGIFEKKS